MRGLVFEWVEDSVSVWVIERFYQRGWVSERMGELERMVRGEVGRNVG